jgi:nucleoside-diphosphate-sugar epimerase
MCREVALQTGAPPPRFRIPLIAARAAAWALEHAFAGSGRKLPLDNDKIDFFRVHHQYSIDRASLLLDWRPRTSFAEGVAQTLEQLRANGRLG